MKHNGNRIIRYIPLICIILFIWIHSMIPGEESTVESEFIRKIVTPILEIFVGKGNVTLHLVRKLAHFTEYFVLGIISTLTIPSNHRYFLTISLGILVASIDEIIQLFVPGRAGMFKDVMLDFSGVLLAVFLIYLFKLLLNKSKKL